MGPIFDDNDRQKNKFWNTAPVNPLAEACDYNVSVHDHVVLPDLAGIPGRWLTGLPQPAMNPNTDWPQGLKVQWRSPPDLGFYMTFTDEVLDWSRERLALLPWLYVHSSSVQPAIHLAWYLGCASLMLVGIDGGSGQAQASQAVPGGKSAPQDYGRFQPHTTLVCDRLFGNGWRHWMPPACGGNDECRMSNVECPIGEKWKYEGIYGPGGLPGYGHSNHGANALEWLVQRHTSVLDVGCGHNEFVKEWRNQSVPVLMATLKPVQFCVGIDMRTWQCHDRYARDAFKAQCMDHILREVRQHLDQHFLLNGQP